MEHCGYWKEYWYQIHLIHVDRMDIMFQRPCVYMCMCMCVFFLKMYPAVVHLCYWWEPFLCMYQCVHKDINYRNGRPIDHPGMSFTTFCAFLSPYCAIILFPILLYADKSYRLQFTSHYKREKRYGMPYKYEKGINEKLELR